VKFWYFFGQIVLVNTISPDRLVRSSLNLVCVFPTMSTGTLLFLVQIQGLFGSKLRKNVILLVNTTSPDCLVRPILNLVCVFPTMSTGTLLFFVQIQGLFGSKLRKSVILWNFDIFWENCACKHDKSRPPGPIKFKLGVCVPHYEYRNPIVLGRGLRSSEVNIGQTLKILKNLVNMPSPPCMVRSTLGFLLPY